MELDNFIRAVLLIVLMFAFIGLAFWAWSKERRSDFEFMSRLPLDENDNFEEPLHEAVLNHKQKVNGESNVKY